MPSQIKRRKRLLLSVGVLVFLLGGAVGFWYFFLSTPEPTGILRGSGRIEGTEIRIAARVGGESRCSLSERGNMYSVWKMCLFPGKHAR